MVNHRVDIEWDRASNRKLVSSGPRDALDRPPRGVRRLHPAELQRLESWLSAEKKTPPELDPIRRKRLTEVTVRQGQAEFRDRLLAAYDGRCAVSGCATTDVLQAAHIAGYAGGGRNHVANGLLLRSDLHLLFDLDLLWIDSAYVIHVAPDITDRTYRRFDGKRLRLPKRVVDRPSKQALRARQSH